MSISFSILEIRKKLDLIPQQSQNGAIVVEMVAAVVLLLLS